MKKVFTAASLLISLFAQPGIAQVGIFQRNGVVSTTPTASQSYCIDYSGHVPQLKGYYDPTGGGSPAWQQMTPPYSNYNGSGAPTSTTDNTLGYSVGSVYYDTVGGNLYACSNATTSAAVWTQINGTLLPTNVTVKLTEADWLGDFVVSGLLGSTPGSGLVMSTPSGVAYVGGTRISASPGSNTYTASKDTYDYLQSGGTLNHVAVNNGASAPIGQTGLFIQKVVSGASNISAVTQTVNISPPSLTVNTQGINLLSGSSPYWFTMNLVPGSLTANRVYTLPETGANGNVMIGTSVSGTSGDAFLASGSIAPGSFGDLAIVNGGTGSRTAGGALTNLGAASSGANSSITSLSGLTTPLTVNQGGSGAGTFTAHGVLVGEGTGPFVPLAVGTSGWPVVSGGSGGDPSVAQLTATGIANGTITTTQISGTAGITSAQLANTAVTAASYTSTNLTVNAQGQITAASSGASSAGFGGNGADGAIVISGATDYHGPIQKNATTFTVSSGQTLTLDTASPVIINATGAITITGAITYTAGSGGNGGIGSASTTSNVSWGADGAGPGGGCGAKPPNSNVFQAGGGGGSSGAGGAGAYTNASTVVSGGTGGMAYQSWMGGGSGGGGGQGYNGGTGGAGGNGGGYCALIAVGALSFGASSTFTSSGAAGQTGPNIDSGGGGGGGGGFLVCASQTSITFTAGSVVTCLGGTGGTGGTTSGPGGGGGGGGTRIAWSPSNTLSGTTTLTGGAAGTSSGAGSGNAAGANGTALSITGTPNLPLIVWMGIQKPTDVASARTWGDGVKFLHRQELNGIHEIGQRDLAREYAHGDLNLYAKALTPGFDAQEPTCLNEANEVLKDAA